MGKWFWSYHMHNPEWSNIPTSLFAKNERKLKEWRERCIGWLIVPGTPRVKRQLWICTYMLPSPPVLSSLVMDFFAWQIAIAGYFLDDISTNEKSFSIAWMALKKVIISHLIPENSHSDLPARGSVKTDLLPIPIERCYLTLATACHLTGYILRMIKQNSLHQEVNCF